jgi:hypothetical protein
MKRKELKQLNEKIEQQAMQILIQEETNNDISTQLRFWQTKAMSMEVSILYHNIYFIMKTIFSLSRRKKEERKEVKNYCYHFKKILIFLNKYRN